MKQEKIRPLRRKNLTAFRSPIEYQYYLALRLSILDGQESLDRVAGLLLLDLDVRERDHKVIFLPHILQVPLETCRRSTACKREMPTEKTV